jgi:transcriptional regulator with XRE-family HTH domain
MAAHERRTQRARRLARTSLIESGRAVREARLEHDLSMAICAAAIGVSEATWSRLERGLSPALSIARLTEATAVVGLDAKVRAYPGGSPLRDQAHVDLLDRFRSRLDPRIRWATEVPLPIAQDQRAWDGLAMTSDVRIGVEAETRARDAQALKRRLEQKQRDGKVDRVVLLLADTRHNRSFLRAAGRGFTDAFPIPGAVALDRLAHGRDPGGNAIVLLKP